MKKIYAFIITAVIAVSSVCIYSNKANLSTLMDANVDALAQYETTMSITCNGSISSLVRRNVINARLSGRQLEVMDTVQDLAEDVYAENNINIPDLYFDDYILLYI